MANAFTLSIEEIKALIAGNPNAPESLKTKVAEVEQQESAKKAVAELTATLTERANTFIPALTAETENLPKGLEQIKIVATYGKVGEFHQFYVDPNAAPLVTYATSSKYYSDDIIAIWKESNLDDTPKSVKSWLKEKFGALFTDVAEKQICGEAVKKCKGILADLSKLNDGIAIPPGVSISIVFHYYHVNEIKWTATVSSGTKAPSPPKTPRTPKDPNAPKTTNGKMGPHTGGSVWEYAAQMPENDLGRMFYDKHASDTQGKQMSWYFKELIKKHDNGSDELYKSWLAGTAITDHADWLA